VITGFNTDVDFQGVTYHVQTEDKGLATPFILSLVYIRGTILASKRSPYEDLVEQGFDEKVLAERLQKQHKTICAAIKAGKIEQLKEMTAKAAAAKQKKAAEIKNAEVKETVVVAVNQQSPVKPELKPIGNFAPQIENKPVQPAQQREIAAEKQPETIAVGVANSGNKVSVYKGADSPIPKPKYDFSIKSAQSSELRRNVENTAIQFAEDELIIEAVEIIELDDELILPDEAVEIVEIAPQRPTDNKLKLEIFGDDVFKSGEKKTMSILVYRGSRESGLNNAQVMIKVLGAAFRPLIFHGKTDEKGIAKIHLQMPLFKQGRAAILIKAMSEGEEIELRRTIKHK
jgi:hypothetical protein